MDLNDFVPFIIKAKEVELDEQIRSQWVAMLPQMALKKLKYMPYEEYKNQCTGKNIDLRSTEEIIAELEELHGTKLV